MVPYDPELAKARIAQLKQNLADTKAAQTPEAIAQHAKVMADAQQDAHLITDLEQQMEAAHEIERAEIRDLEKNQDVTPEKKLQTDEEIELARRDKILAEDVQIKNIMEMKTKNDVEAYMLQEFGEGIDRNMNVSQLKNFALNKRTERLFEFEG
jgi:hypothetical protein